MRPFLRHTVIVAAAFCIQACGEQTLASADCEEYARLMEHLTLQAGAPLAATQIPHCEERLVKTSTRCQGAFRDLVECSRAYDSVPQLRLHQCQSEWVEQQTSCMVPPAS